MQTHDEIEPLKNSGDKDQKTFTLKLVLAGSGQNHFRKVNFDENGNPFIDQYGYFKDDTFDLTNFKVADQTVLGIIKDAIGRVGIKKGDFFYKYSRSKNQLSLYRPGPGANPNKPYRPLFKRGLFDSGRYSINRTYSLCLKLLKSLILPLAMQYGKVKLPIVGHSRGGVSASSLQRTLETFCDELDLSSYVKCFAVCLDPVTGPDNLSKKNVDFIDNRNISRKKEFSNSLVLSVNSKHCWGFSPQYLKNVDVIIITSLGHGVGNQNIYYDKETVKYSKPKWKYGGKIYNYGRIYELPPGVYFPNSQEINSDLDKQLRDIPIRTEGSFLPLENEKHIANQDSLLITLRKLPAKTTNENEKKKLIESLNEMSKILKLDDILQKHSSRKNYILNLLNEKYPDGKEELYWGDGEFSWVNKLPKIKGFIAKSVENLKRYTGF